MPGVWKVTVNFDNKEARVTYDAKLATVDLMAIALQTEGFEGSMKSEPVAAPGS